MTEPPDPERDNWPIAGYAPYAGGRYTTGAAFFPLKRDFGNGALDGRRYQIDAEYRVHLANKRAARSEDWTKYSVMDNADPAALRVVALDALAHMMREYPELFALRENDGLLENQINGERIRFNAAGELLEFVAADGAPLPAHSLFDALFAQLPEDAALIELDPAGARGDRLSALHLTAPNYWSPADKIGRDFAAIHAPVPGMDEVLKRYPPLLAGVIRQGPFVRFAWGLGTDARLNHHPIPPPGRDALDWRGRRFNPTRPALFVRYERQVLSGFAAPRPCLLFTIRTYFADVGTLAPARLQALAAALRSMTPETLAYKGLDETRDAILAYIEVLLQTKNSAHDAGAAGGRA